VNEERFLDWLFMSLPGFLFWLIGYFSRPRYTHIASRNIIRVPFWVAILMGGRTWVEIRSFTIQLCGVILFALTTLAALFEPEHEKRVVYFRTGFIILLFASWVFMEILLIRSRRQ